MFSAVLNPELVTMSDVNGKRKWEQSFVITEIYWPVYWDCAQTFACDLAEIALYCLDPGGAEAAAF